MFNIGLPEIIIIAFVIVLFFGGKKIPDLVRGLTDSVREFRKAMRDEDNGTKKK